MGAPCSWARGKSSDIRTSKATLIFDLEGIERVISICGVRMGGPVIRKMKGTLRGKLYVMAAALLWATIGVATKLALAAGADPAGMGAARSTVSGVLSLISLRKRVLDRRIAALGLLFTGPLYLSYMFSVMYSGIGIAAVLLYTAPAIVIVASRIFLSEPITKRKILALALTGSGVFLIHLPRLADPNPLGMAFGLVSAVSYAGIIVMARRLVTDGYTPWEVGIGPQFWGGVELLPFLLLTSLPWFDPIVLGGALYLGIFTSFIAYYLHAMGVREIEAGVAGIVSNLEPAAAIAFGMLMGEALGPVELLGAALVVSGAVLAG